MKATMMVVGALAVACAQEPSGGCPNPTDEPQQNCDCLCKAGAACTAQTCDGGMLCPSPPSGRYLHCACNPVGHDLATLCQRLWEGGQP